MANFTPTPLTTLANEAAAVSRINDNLTDIADAIDELLGVKRIYIDSRNFTGMIRKRYYWTNIPIGEISKKFSDVRSSKYRYLGSLPR